MAKTYNPRSNKAIALKEVLQQVVQELGLSNKLEEQQAIEVWHKLMGPAISRKTVKVAIYEAKMYITIYSAPLKQELFNARGTIKDKINEQLGKVFVKEVIFL